MPMLYKSEILHQTSDFDSFQILPRSILAMGMASWAGIIKKNIHSFPTLIKDFNLGLVVVSTNIKYLEPYDFFSGVSYTVSNEMWITPDRKLLVWDISFIDSSGKKFISLDALGRAVKIDPMSWGAVPTDIEPPLLEFFGKEDYFTNEISRPVDDCLKSLKHHQPIAENEITKRIYRHECEAADQWSFIEIGKNAANAREEMLLECNPAENLVGMVKGLLNKPVSKINTVIKRPLFLFDQYKIASSLYKTESEFIVVHRFLSTVGRSKEHAIVIDTFIGLENFNWLVVAMNTNGQYRLH